MYSQNTKYAAHVKDIKDKTRGQWYAGPVHVWQSGLMLQTVNLAGPG